MKQDLFAIPEETVLFFCAGEQGKREDRLMVSSHLLGIYWWTQGFTQVYILHELGSLIFFLEIKSLLITEYLLASK